MNTWGIYSVNTTTFNNCREEERRIYYPKNCRDKIYTALKLNNLTFNILGYIPGVSIVSGSIRMAVGAAIVGTTLCIGDRKAEEGVIIGRFYDEAIATGVAQIARGALEAFVPFGHLANLALDVVATPWNVTRSALWNMHCGGHGEMFDPCTICSIETKAPEYPLLVTPLHLV